MTPAEQPSAFQAMFRNRTGDTSAILEWWTVASDIGVKPSRDGPNFFGSRGRSSPIA